MPPLARLLVRGRGRGGGRTGNDDADGETGFAMKQAAAGGGGSDGTCELKVEEEEII